MSNDYPPAWPPQQHLAPPRPEQDPRLVFGPLHDEPPHAARRRRGLPRWVLAGIAVAAGLGGFTIAMAALTATTGTTSAGPTVAASAPAKTAQPKPSAAAAAGAAPVEKVTASQANALRSAERYLEVSAFSKAGLIEQLSSEYGDGYPKADAAWAVSRLDVDWREQAVRKGQDYLEMMGFSRTGLIEQLSSEHGDEFTKAEATYAADKLGL